MQKRNFLIGIAAFIASLGTMPFGYRYAETLHLPSPILTISLGIVLAVTAAFANMLLGVYSLKSMRIKKYDKQFYLLITISIANAIPNGCMFYFAYKNIVPFMINAIATGMVIIINMGIGYTAFVNLLKECDFTKTKIAPMEAAFRIIGFFIGIGVSLAAWMAATNGLYGMLGMIGTWQHNFTLAIILGFITWTPLAALHSNTMQITLGKCYDLLLHMKRELKKIDKVTFIFLFICFLSGASYCQISREFFDPALHIPGFFKLPAVQYFVYSFIVPLAFISSAAVNFLAIQRMRGKVSKT